MMRVVLDSNVILSGLMPPNGTTGQIIQAWKNNQLTLLICEVQLEEIKRVLAYPKIQKRLNCSPSQFMNHKGWVHDENCRLYRG